MAKVYDGEMYHEHSDYNENFREKNKSMCFYGHTEPFAKQLKAAGGRQVHNSERFYVPIENVTSELLALGLTYHEPITDYSVKLPELPELPMSLDGKKFVSYPVAIVTYKGESLEFFFNGLNTVSISGKLTVNRVTFSARIDYLYDEAKGYWKANSQHISRSPYGSDVSVSARNKLTDIFGGLLADMLNKHSILNQWADAVFQNNEVEKRISKVNELNREIVKLQIEQKDSTSLLLNRLQQIKQN